MLAAIRARDASECVRRFLKNMMSLSTCQRGMCCAGGCVSIPVLPRIDLFGDPSEGALGAGLSNRTFHFYDNGLRSICPACRNMLVPICFRPDGPHGLFCTRCCREHNDIARMEDRVVRNSVR